jgi:hypothetical protein
LVSDRTPTAKQLVALEHETADIGVGVGRNGLGLGVIDHAAAAPEGAALATTPPATSPTTTKSRPSVRDRRDDFDAPVTSRLETMHPSARTVEPTRKLHNVDAPEWTDY